MKTLYFSDLTTVQVLMYPSGNYLCIYKQKHIYGFTINWIIKFHIVLQHFSTLYTGKLVLLE